MPCALRCFCYNNLRASEQFDMRTAIQIVAVLAMASLLAPTVRWASLGGPLESCACPPDACMCEGHHHGHMHTCCMGKGGQCGWQAPDTYLSSVLSTLIFLTAGHTWQSPLAASVYGACYISLHLLPSHERIPELPPRRTP